MNENEPTYQVAKLSKFTKGWFVGNFAPSLQITDDFEIAIKTYFSGDHEPSHHHKIATEITAIIRGRVRMLGREFVSGDIVKIPPGTSTAFTAVEGSTTVVVKFPSVLDDKYLD